MLKKKETGANNLHSFGVVEPSAEYFNQAPHIACNVQFKRTCRQHGASLVEYVLLVAFVALIAIVGVAAIWGVTRDKFDTADRADRMVYRSGEI